MTRALVFLMMAHAALHPEALQAQGFDRLGIPVFTQTDLLTRPATAVAAGWVVRVSVAEPVLAARIREQHLYLHRCGTRVGLATQLTRQGSDIHARTTLGAALQLRAAGNAWGLAAGLDQWSFAGGLQRQRWRGRLAFGRGIGRRATLALQMRTPLTRHGRAVFELHLSSSHLSPFYLVFREQRMVGLPVMRQFGVIWGDDQVSLHAGFNGTTMATSLGIALSTDQWSWIASGITHPFLGSGRQWGLALSSR